MADATDAGIKVGWLRTNRAISILLTVLLATFLVYLLSTDWVHQDLRDGFKLGFFPVAGAVAMLACCVVMIIDRQRRVVADDLRMASWTNLFWCVVILAICYAYFSLAWSLGFLAMSPIFLIAGMYGLGARPLRSVVLIAALISLGIYGAFRLIGIQLPAGILPI